MMELKDSGERRQFDSGAVRDIQEGKGRCDLLPINEIGVFLGEPVLCEISKFKRDGMADHIYEAVRFFIENEGMETYSAVLDLAKHYEDGAKKYDERNWEKGIPIHCFVDSGIRHYLKHKRGDTDEPHDRAFLWNMFGLIWTYTNHPELDDFTGIVVDTTVSSKEDENA